MLSSGSAGGVPAGPLSAEHEASAWDAMVYNSSMQGDEALLDDMELLDDALLMGDSLLVQQETPTGEIIDASRVLLDDRVLRELVQRGDAHRHPLRDAIGTTRDLLDSVQEVQDAAAASAPTVPTQEERHLAATFAEELQAFEEQRAQHAAVHAERGALRETWATEKAAHEVKRAALLDEQRRVHDNRQLSRHQTFVEHFQDVLNQQNRQAAKRVQYATRLQLQEVHRDNSWESLSAQLDSDVLRQLSALQDELGAESASLHRASSARRDELTELRLRHARLQQRCAETRAACDRKEYIVASRRNLSGSDVGAALRQCDDMVRKAELAKLSLTSPEKFRIFPLSPGSHLRTTIGDATPLVASPPPPFFARSAPNPHAAATATTTTPPASPPRSSCGTATTASTTPPPHGLAATATTTPPGTPAVPRSTPPAAAAAAAEPEPEPEAEAEAVHYPDVVGGLSLAVLYEGGRPVVESGALLPSISVRLLLGDALNSRILCDAALAEAIEDVTEGCPAVLAAVTPGVTLTGELTGAVRGLSCVFSNVALHGSPGMEAVLCVTLATSPPKAQNLTLKVRQEGTTVSVGGPFVTLAASPPSVLPRHVSLDGVRCVVPPSGRVPRQGLRLRCPDPALQAPIFDGFAGPGSADIWSDALIDTASDSPAITVCSVPGVPDVPGDLTVLHLLPPREVAAAAAEKEEAVPAPPNKQRGSGPGVGTAAEPMRSLLMCADGVAQAVGVVVGEGGVAALAGPGGEVFQQQQHGVQGEAPDAGGGVLPGALQGFEVSLVCTGGTTLVYAGYSRTRSRFETHACFSWGLGGEQQHQQGQHPPPFSHIPVPRASCLAVIPARNWAAVASGASASLWSGTPLAPEAVVECRDAVRMAAGYGPRLALLDVAGRLLVWDSPRVVLDSSLSATHAAWAEVRGEGCVVTAQRGGRVALLRATAPSAAQQGSTQAGDAGAEDVGVHPLAPAAAEVLALRVVPACHPQGCAAPPRCACCEQSDLLVTVSHDLLCLWDLGAKCLVHRVQAHPLRGVTLRCASPTSPAEDAWCGGALSVPEEPVAAFSPICEAFCVARPTYFTPEVVICVGVGTGALRVVHLKPLDGVGGAGGGAVRGAGVTAAVPSMLPPAVGWTQRECVLLGPGAVEGTALATRCVGFMKANGIAPPNPCTDGAMREVIVDHITRCKLDGTPYTDWWVLAPPPQAM